MTPTRAKQANDQIRRLRAALQNARDTLCDHFGPHDDSVTACDRALAPSKPVQSFEREAVKVTRLGAAMMIDRDGHAVGGLVSRKIKYYE